MGPLSRRKSQDVRLDFRLTLDAKAAIERAAAVRGQSVPDFAVSTLFDKAKRVLEEEVTRTFSNRDRDIFLQMLDDTSRKPNQALRKAASRYKSSVSGRRD